MRRAELIAHVGRPTRRVRVARPHLKFERQLRVSGTAQMIAGIDEAGRGPLAGPVVAAAVILPDDFEHRALHDSKQLSPAMRETIFLELTGSPAIVWAFAALDAQEIDRLNILRAAHEAMRQAVLGLDVIADHALIDGLPVRPFPIAHTALVAGDSRSLSIAAASVIAKVTRDRMMVEFCALYPVYGFSRHKGYPTDEHLATLDRHGPCPIHRRSFGPVARHFRPKLPADPRHVLGLTGEGHAADFLRRSGYKVLRRRFRPRNHRGEIDLVCRHGNTLVFVEVKTRSSLALGRPAEAVTADKERLIIQGAVAWLRMLHQTEVPVRFDIVEVVLAPGGAPACTVIENAFGLPAHYLP